jgi:type 1 glutamine amidotransferase
MRKQLKINGLIKTLAMLATVVLLVFNNHAFSKQKARVLVFSKTKGYHHGSIAAGIAAITKLGQENNFDVDTTIDSKKFTYEKLKQYAAIIFLSTTGEFFNDDAPKDALKKYIEHGGGFVGIHAATDGEYNWQWYGDLVGAYFKGHPGGTPLATLDVIDSNFIATRHLPRRWTRKDEWYHFKWMAPDLHVLIKLDETSFTYPLKDEHLKMGANHPVAWYHEFDGGRSFYTALGHTDESFSDPVYLQHLLGGIEYAMGKKYKNNKS